MTVREGWARQAGSFMTFSHHAFVCSVGVTVSQLALRAHACWEGFSALSLELLLNFACSCAWALCNFPCAAVPACCLFSPMEEGDEMEEQDKTAWHGNIISLKQHPSVCPHPFLPYICLYFLLEFVLPGEGGGHACPGLPSQCAGNMHEHLSY